MTFKKMIKVGGFRYDTRPKMGTSNVFNGVFLNDKQEKKMAKKMNSQKSKKKK